MDNLLPEVINTYSDLSRRLVSSLIQEVKVDKNDLSSLISKVRSFNSGSYFPNTVIRKFSRLDSEVLRDLFRDTDIRLERLFMGANSIGIALSSMVNVFQSEIEKLEKDIHNLENFIDNYEYLSGKENGYNLYYIEDFDEESLDYRADGLNFTLPDRDGKPFPDNGGYFIDYSTSSLKIGKKTQSINVLDNIKNITFNTNYDNYISTFTDSNSLFDSDYRSTWSVSVNSPIILKTAPTKAVDALSSYTAIPPGAKTHMLVEFETPIRADSIKVHPDMFAGMSILQIEVYGIDGTENFGDYEVKNISNNKLLQNPVMLNGIVEIDFEETLIHKIAFLFNQNIYTRSKINTIYSELYSRSITEHIRSINEKRSKQFSQLQDMVYGFFIKENTVKGIRTNYEVLGNYYSNKFPISRRNVVSHAVSDGIVEESDEISNLKTFTKYSPVYRLVRSAFESFNREIRLFQDDIHIQSPLSPVSTGEMTAKPVFVRKSHNHINNIEGQYLDPVIGGEKIDSLSQNFYLEETSASYNYRFSIRELEFSISDREQVFGDISQVSEENVQESDDSEDTSFVPQNYEKACFVSRRIAQNDHIEALKIKLNELETLNKAYDPNLTKYDLQDLFSYELSVSNVEFPDSEEDWYPIAPSRYTSIDSEVLFFQGSRTASLRFPAVYGVVTIYKNGIEVSPKEFEILPDNQTIKLLDNLQITEADVFVASYSLDYSRSTADTIDFSNAGLFQESLRTYTTSQGEGQRFDNPVSMMDLNLDYIPYVDSRYSSNATFNPYSGTNFLGDSTGYSPVKILINNQSYAVNVTNYTNSGQEANFRDQFFTNNSNVTYFKHVGRRVTFSRAINVPIVVYYEYVPSNLRFRLITRKNIPNLSGSPSIDSVLVKMKTRVYDPYYDRLKFLNSVQG